MNEYDKQLINYWSLKHFFNAEQDRYKEKKLICNSFARTNSFGFNQESLFIYLFSDVYNRYLKMNGYNVLYTTGLNNSAYSAISFAKNHSLDYQEVPLNFKSNLDDLGIGYDSNYFYKTTDNKLLLELDNFFKDEYMNHIKYVSKEVYANKEKNRYYNDFEINFSFGHAYSKYSGEELFLTKANVFVLDFSEFEDDIRNNISNLKIDDKYKEELLHTLGDYQTLTIPFKINDNLNLDIELLEPELMSGISFIALNPLKMDVLKYVSNEEYDEVYKYMQNGYSAGKFTGFMAKNPINYHDICLIVSYTFDEAIHVGIPAKSNADFEFAKEFGLDTIELFRGDQLINSDFLDGLNQEKAKEKILEESRMEDFGIIKHHFKIHDLIISNSDNIGTPIPFEVIDDGFNYKVVDSKYFPLVQNKFLKVLYGLTPEKNIELINHTFNSIYQTSVIKNYLDNKNIYFESDEFVNHVIDIIYEEELAQAILFPLIFKLVSGKTIVNHDYIILKDSYPDQDFIQENNNLNISFVSDSLGKYSTDAIRLYTLKKSRDKNFEEIFFKLNKAEQFLAELGQKFSEGFVDNNYNLDNEIYQLVNEINRNIKENKLEDYAANIEFFFYKTLKNKKWTEDEALIYLKLLSPICPFICEKLFKEIYNSENLLFEEWPTY